MSIFGRLTSEEEEIDFVSDLKIEISTLHIGISFSTWLFYWQTDWLPVCLVGWLHVINAYTLKICSNFIYLLSLSFFFALFIWLLSSAFLVLTVLKNLQRTKKNGEKERKRICNNSTSANKTTILFFLFHSFISHNSTFDTCAYTSAWRCCIWLWVSLRTSWFDEQIAFARSVCMCANDHYYLWIVTIQPRCDMAYDCNIND